MHRLEYAATVTVVHAGHDSQASYQAGCQIRDDVSVKVLAQHDIEVLRPGDNLQACDIDDVFVALDARRPAGHITAGLQKESVAHFHDVRVVNYRDLLTPRAPGKFEGEMGDPFGSFPSDDLEALHTP